MRLSIISDDGMVIANGAARNVDLSGIVPGEVHALQWFTNWGEIERRNLTNQPITELPAWAVAALKAWEDAEPEEPEPAE